MSTTNSTTAPSIESVDVLYVANARTSNRRYHLDEDCPRLQLEPRERRAEIAASWYDPCRYCVTGEFPRGADSE